MVNASPGNIVKAVYEFYGYTFCQRLRITIGGNSPEELFKLLVASFLFGAGAGVQSMMKAYGAFERCQWLEPRRLADASPDERRSALVAAGYRRDEKNTAAMLPDLAAAVMERYSWDLRNLREHAGRDPHKERRLLEEIRGIDEIGSDLFFQEIQTVWDECYPFAGKIALRGARKIMLSPEARILAPLVRKQDFPGFTASLLEMEQDDRAPRVLAEAQKLEHFLEMPF